MNVKLRNRRAVEVGLRKFLVSRASISVASSNFVILFFTPPVVSRCCLAAARAGQCGPAPEYDFNHLRKRGEL